MATDHASSKRQISAATYLSQPPDHQAWLCSLSGPASVFAHQPGIQQPSNRPAQNPNQHLLLTDTAEQHTFVMHIFKRYILPVSALLLMLKLNDVDSKLTKTQWIQDTGHRCCDSHKHVQSFWLVHLSSGHKTRVWQPHPVSLIISQLLQVGSRQHCKAGCPLLQRHVIQILLSIGPEPVETQDRGFRGRKRQSVSFLFNPDAGPGPCVNTTGN